MSTDSSYSNTTDWANSIFAMYMREMILQSTEILENSVDTVFFTYEAFENHDKNTQIVA